MLCHYKSIYLINRLVWGEGYLMITLSKTHCCETLKPISARLNSRQCKIQSNCFYFTSNIYHNHFVIKKPPLLEFNITIQIFKPQLLPIYFFTSRLVEILIIYNFN